MTHSLDMSLSSDILVIGGGIIGVAIALELRLRGAGTVTVLTRDRQSAATRAAAGMLAPHAEHIPPGALLDLGRKSLALYPEWVQRIEDLSGISTGYWPSGILAPVYADGVNVEGQGEGRSPQCSAAQWLDREMIHQVQPGLGPEVAGGWWHPEDGQVDNRKLFDALWAAAERSDITLKDGVSVEAIQQNHGRITRVCTSSGLYHADQYVLAAGAWSSELMPLPLKPVKGQMMSVTVPSTDGTGQAHPLRRVLFGPDSYIVPRQDGRIIIGATVESVGFTPHTTPAGLHRLLSAAIRLYPALKDYPVADTWWGFRPTPPDEAPILGPGHCDNLTLATGHHRNGILLAPATAMLVADWVWNRASSDLLAAFSWQRFFTTSCGAAPSPDRISEDASAERQYLNPPSSNHQFPHSGSRLSTVQATTMQPTTIQPTTMHTLDMSTPHSAPTSSSDSTSNLLSTDAPLTIAGRTFRSRLMTGTGKYRTLDQMHRAIAASGCEIVTVAVRRVQAQAPGHEGLAEALDWTKLWMLPNTAGCKSAEDAIRVARLGREMAKLLGQEDNNFVKLEVIPDATYLLPDPIGTLEAAEQLVKEGFAVLPYINADPLLAKRLEDVGCATVMPLGSPIGSGQGIRNAANIQIIIENATVPVVVDAGIGTPSEAAQAMEMGASALLINTAIAQASDPERMGRAMGLATDAGRLAFLAGRIPIKQSASASSPLTGTISSSTTISP